MKKPPHAQQSVVLHCTRIPTAQQLQYVLLPHAHLQVGWHALKPHLEPPGERFTLPHTDVTRKEGRTHATYYGEALGHQA